MDRQATAYNEAVAASTNEFFLLSALRARDRFPIYYTRTTGNNAGASLTPGATFAVSNWLQSPSITMSASASNTLSLANLDDQKFMRGVLAPVPLSIMESYVGQTWPREVLMMMFIKKFKINSGLASELVGKFDKRCVDSKQNGDYCDNKRPPSEVSPSTKLRTLGCLAVNKPASPDDLIFDNYPGDPRMALPCFQAMLRVLLSLGFSPADGTKFSVIVPAMPPARAQDLKGLSQALNAKLAISRNEGSSNYAVCTKKDVSGFTLDKVLFTNEKPSSPAEQDETIALRRVSSHALKMAGQSDGLRAEEDGASRALKQVSSHALQMTGQSGGGLRAEENGASLQGTTSLIAPEMPTTCSEQVTQDRAAKKLADSCKAKKAKNTVVSNECKDPPTFAVTTRSLDSMLYYLGEDLRANGSVKVWEKDGQESYALFDAKHDDQSDSTLVEVQYRGNRWVIPSICKDTVNYCEQTHRSLQVLSLLNQIWGLQKEASETPTVPVVSVINSH